ncbi:EAL domain-containing protein [Butyrivibrio sp. MC2013]|uniref:EAL domain-containing protein n=1 Tax=Butyrivibrio sp. MC2013 TaxID=1280686 RepID=UPI0003FF5241|nr:EAL domain-containing protein [Butyrivibrio sp. MC2013]
MVTFLTSSFLDNRNDDYEGRTPILDDNQFVPRLKKYWQKSSNLLMIAGHPELYEDSDRVLKNLIDAFKMVEIPVREGKVLDERNADDTSDLIKWADVIFVASGNGLRQNEFLNRNNIKEELKNFPGIVLTSGTGSVNAGSKAFMIPELTGEEVKEGECRFVEGLGLTDLSMIPNADALKKKVCMDKNVVYDIILPSSKDRKFVLINDGSYFVVDRTQLRFYGRGEIIENGGIRNIENYIGNRIWDSIMQNGYEAVYRINADDMSMVQFYLGTVFRHKELGGQFIKFYPELISKMMDSLAVEEEKSTMTAAFEWPIVSEEISKYGTFARTMHTILPEGRRALMVRIVKLDEDDSSYILTVRNITETLDRDWMTDVFSRTGFMSHAQHMITALDLRDGYSMVYTNIHAFKTVNDIFGESSGDLVIFQSEHAIRECLDPLLVGRLENDHFVAICKDSMLTEENFTRLCYQTYEEESKKFEFCIYCGIYSIKRSDISLGIMLDRAKMAEKSIREDQMCPYASYNENMRQSYVAQQILITDLKNAIENRELMPFYQPIVDSKSGEVVSAEALVRWNHHDMGMVSPGIFIPALEKSGKVSQVDRYMLERVVEFLAEQHKSGRKVVPCSVNLSRMDFFDSEMLQAVPDILRDSGIPLELIKFEITESAYADLEKNATMILNSFRQHGIKILLDDYGSGMSSMSTLESYEFDTIKLDMGFIRKIGRSSKAEAIIRSTIRLAHELGEDTVAEGVESVEQVDFLKDADCDMIQGYHFYKPMSQDDFRNVLNG